MAESHVLSALTKKRAELLGDIRYYKKQIYDLDKDLANVDATIRIFEPNFKFGAIKPINKRVKKVFFQTGKITLNTYTQDEFLETEMDITEQVTVLVLDKLYDEYGLEDGDELLITKNKSLDRRTKFQMKK